MSRPTERQSALLPQDIVNKERLIKERYGDGMGIECYRSGFFAVHPDYQGRGYGRAMQAHTDAEVSGSFAGRPLSREKRQSDASLRLHLSLLFLLPPGRAKRCTFLFLLGGQERESSGAGAFQLPAGLRLIR